MLQNALKKGLVAGVEGRGSGASGAGGGTGSGGVIVPLEGAEFCSSNA